MKLKTKLFALFSAASIFIVLAFGWLIYNRLWDEQLVQIQESIAQQLQDFNFSLKNFFVEVEGDVNALADNELVRSRDDSHFTSFLQADEANFSYNYSELEKKIIQIFNTHRLRHTYVSSVYMGRENGSFVRSHPRERPTLYDPRERLWYKLAKTRPGQVLKTDAYPSLTTDDINIGVVKALVDESGTVYGVVGIDVTLADLTSYILNFSIRPAGRIFLVDRNGMVIASQEKGVHGKKISDYSEELGTLLTQKTSITSLEIQGQEMFLFQQKFTERDWKLAVLVPAADIETLIRGTVLWPVIILVAGLLLLSALTLFGLHIFVISPLKTFSEETTFITRTGNLDRRIHINTHDEIGALANSYNEMLGSLERSQKALRETQKDLTQHRDHLEELVAQRTQELESTLRDLAAAKERAESADHLKSAFLATMSHELRTPLNSIIGFTGIMLQGLAGPLNTEQHKQMSMVRNSSRHLLSLINDVLDISKIEAGQLQLTFATFELRPSIENMAKLVLPMAEQKGIALHVDIHDPIGTLTTDQRRLEQVMLNLFNNAVKFTEKGYVRISCHIENDHILLAVSDSGIGMKPEDIPHLFQPFHQIDTGLTRKHEGTGLGLSICKKLLDMMGGSIGVESRWGEGSTFTVRFPRQNGGRHE